MTSSLPLTATPSGERRCVCVANHTPEPRELHRHHVWPLGKGGPDTTINLRWLCLPGEAPVTMGDGALRRIDEVHVGDVVFGHDGLPHHVTGVTVSSSDENIVRLDDLLLTADHLVLTPFGWTPAGLLRKGDEVRRLETFGERVDAHVFSLVDTEPQVLGSVVIGDEIDVVDDLGSSEFTTDDLLHDEACPLHNPAIIAVPYGENDMPLAVEPAATLTFGRARDTLENSKTTLVATELRSARTLVGAQDKLGAALQTRLLDRLDASLGRGAVARTGSVPAGVRRGVFEVFTAGSARFDSKTKLAASHRRWDALAHVERAPHDGYLYDITIADSHSFVAGGVVVHNCPTSHSNVHQLWRIYDACNGQVGGAILRRYNPYVRQLVADGWAQAHPESVLF